MWWVALEPWLVPGETNLKKKKCLWSFSYGSTTSRPDPWRMAQDSEITCLQCRGQRSPQELYDQNIHAYIYSSVSLCASTCHRQDAHITSKQAADSLMRNHLLSRLTQLDKSPHSVKLSEHRWDLWLPTTGGRSLLWVMPWQTVLGLLYCVLQNVTQPSSMLSVFFGCTCQRKPNPIPNKEHVLGVCVPVTNLRQFQMIWNLCVEIQAHYTRKKKANRLGYVLVCVFGDLGDTYQTFKQWM